MGKTCFVNIARQLLSEPLARGLDLDDPALTELRKGVLRKKKFLRSIYGEWYQMLANSIPGGPGAVLELGSGAGFAREQIPGLFSSEVFWLPDISLVLNGCALPFADHSLKAVMMTDVLHHIPQVREFFTQAARCLKPGGVVVMVEPWVSPWSKFVYHNFHHEPFDPACLTWEFDASGPLSGANGALPWMVFERDKAVFRQEFPSLAVEVVQPMMPFCFLLSGGLSMRGLAPEFSYKWWRSVEGLLDRWNAAFGMFAFIQLRKC